jgi:hypothetical protein
MFKGASKRRGMETARRRALPSTQRWSEERPSRSEQKRGRTI